MVYTEIKERNGKKYFYRVINVRKGKKFKKERIYLGVNLDKANLKESEEKAPGGVKKKRVLYEGLNIDLYLPEIIRKL